MKDRVDIAIEFAVLETVDELVLVEIVGDREIRDIDELVAVA